MNIFDNLIVDTVEVFPKATSFAETTQHVVLHFKIKPFSLELIFHEVETPNNFTPKVVDLDDDFELDGICIDDGLDKFTIFAVDGREITIDLFEFAEDVFPEVNVSFFTSPESEYTHSPIYSGYNYANHELIDIKGDRQWLKELVEEYKCFKKEVIMKRR